MTDEEMAVTFRISTMVGSLAEHFIEEELPRADFTRVSQALTSLEPLNVTEDFALCIAARNPMAARDLALSAPASAAEQAAAGQLTPSVAQCVNPGETQPVDLQALRALTSVALYRGMRRSLAANN